MGYHHVRRISMIEMKKTAEDSAGDFSRESILRRISAGYDQTRAALEETSWSSSLKETSLPVSV